MPACGGASSEELMGVFEIYRESILAAASRKFDKGDMRPRITARILETDLRETPGCQRNPRTSTAQCMRLSM
jgi:hypothetical protein